MIASVPAYTKIFHAIDTFAALCTVVTAGTVKASLALGAELVVRAVFAFFAARHTDYGAVGTPIAAVADLVDAVFAQ